MCPSLAARTLCKLPHSAKFRSFGQQIRPISATFEISRFLFLADFPIFSSCVFPMFVLLCLAWLVPLPSTPTTPTTHTAHTNRTNRTNQTTHENFQTNIQNFQITNPAYIPQKSWDSSRENPWNPQILDFSFFFFCWECAQDFWRFDVFSFFLWNSPYICILI